MKKKKRSIKILKRIKMASEQYKVFSENEKNIKGESMVEIGIKICLRNKTKI